MLFSDQRASIFPLDVRHSRVHLCSWRGFLSRTFGHTSTLGLFSTALWLTLGVVEKKTLFYSTTPYLHGMTIFRTFTLHVLGWQKFCDALMEAHRRPWKKLCSCHSPSHRICLRGMEWRTDSKTPMLTRLIFEETWNNASSPPEEIRLPLLCFFTEYVKS